MKWPFVAARMRQRKSVDFAHMLLLLSHVRYLTETNIYKNKKNKNYARKINREKN